MSSIKLRAEGLQPRDIRASSRGDQVTLTAGAFLWSGTVEDYHLLVEAGWGAIHGAFAHEAKTGKNWKTATKTGVA